MQLCTVHAEAVGFDARNPDPDADREGVQTEADVGSALVVFVAVEASDGRQSAGICAEAAAEIESVMTDLKTPELVLVPCPQLSANPAAATLASDLLDELQTQIETESHRVPMGWDISYDIQTKGHPFAVQTFEIEAPASDDGVWFVSEPGGSLQPIKSASLDDGLGTLLEHEQNPNSGGGNPESLARGERLELFDQREAGWLLLPRGVAARDRLEEWITHRLQEFDASAIQHIGRSAEGTTDPLGLFRDRESTGEPPARAFEIQSERAALGVSTGRGLPASRVPELVSLVADEAGAREEVARYLAWIHQTLALLELAYEPRIRISPAFREKHSEWLGSLTALIGRQTLVEIREDADWPLQVEFVIADEDGVPICRPTVALDERSPGQQGISGPEGESNPLAIRSAPVGSIEQLVTALLATDDAMALPCWLAPTQLRFIPIEPDEHRSFCAQHVASLANACIRVDIDDRDIPVRVRLATADDLEIPYSCVVGDDEVDAETDSEHTPRLKVAIRRDASEVGCSPGELQNRVRQECEPPATDGQSSDRLGTAGRQRFESGE